MATLRKVCGVRVMGEREWWGLYLGFPGIYNAMVFDYQNGVRDLAEGE